MFDEHGHIEFGEISFEYPNPEDTSDDIGHQMLNGANIRLIP